MFDEYDLKERKIVKQILSQLAYFYWFILNEFPWIKSQRLAIVGVI